MIQTQNLNRTEIEQLASKATALVGLQNKKRFRWQKQSLELMLLKISLEPESLGSRLRNIEPIMKQLGLILIKLL